MYVVQYVVDENTYFYTDYMLSFWLLNGLESAHMAKAEGLRHFVMMCTFCAITYIIY